MRSNHSPTETAQIMALLQQHSSFINVFKSDWTKNVLSDLHYRLYGNIPRNFLVNISGLVGTPTGVFKSSMGLQLAHTLDPLFDLNERVAFSVQNLLEKIRNNTEHLFCRAHYDAWRASYKGSYEAGPIDESALMLDKEKHAVCTRPGCGEKPDVMVLLTKMIFFLDEQTRSLRVGNIVRLQNIVDTCRQRQICFITCGVDAYGMHFKTYDLRRVLESHDEYLPKKVVRYAVYDNDRDLYYGYFRWEITPLSNPWWAEVWKRYSAMKAQFQRIAMSQQITSVNFIEYAREIMSEPEFPKTFKRTQRGKFNFQPNIARLLVFRRFPDMTEEERTMILSQIKLTIQMSKDEGREWWSKNLPEGAIEEADDGYGGEDWVPGNSLIGGPEDSFDYGQE